MLKGNEIFNVNKIKLESLNFNTLAQKILTENEIILDLNLDCKKFKCNSPTNNGFSAMDVLNYYYLCLSYFNCNYDECYMKHDEHNHEYINFDNLNLSKIKLQNNYKNEEYRAVIHAILYDVKTNIVSFSVST